jgi:hypothetical protein
MIRLAKLPPFIMLALAGLSTAAAPLSAQVPAKTPEAKASTAKVPAAKAAGVWTDAADPSLPEDFKFQGEYAGDNGNGAKLGCQIIALGGGAFQAVLLPGGLPGEGWNGKDKTLLGGTLDDGQALFKAAEGNRKYLAQSPSEFSATSTFPPAGQQEATATLREGVLKVKFAKGVEASLKRVERKSPSLGAKPPAGAIVLFDGSNTDEWTRGRLDEKTRLLNTDGSDILSKRKFNNYAMHVEFLLPYKPEGRGQGRGNSGFYQVDHFEVQILDSFGLDGKNNECGGVYTKAEPKVNMCLPPLVWQTYDVEFTNAVAENGKKVKNARMTLKHNGVVIHDNLEITGVTGGSRNEPEGTPGPIKLQGHGNPLQFRNVWVVER